MCVWTCEFGYNESSATRVTIKLTSGDLIGRKNKYRFDFYGSESDNRIVVTQAVMTARSRNESMKTNIQHSGYA